MMEKYFGPDLGDESAKENGVFSRFVVFGFLPKKPKVEIKEVFLANAVESGL